MDLSKIAIEDVLQWSPGSFGYMRVPPDAWWSDLLQLVKPLSCSDLEAAALGSLSCFVAHFAVLKMS